jgi:predicted AlkP superfamily phosphohydrolase/phosphomutase/tetratricopeptide (TPR) repeat protein
VARSDWRSGANIGLVAPAPKNRNDWRAECSDFGMPVTPAGPRLAKRVLLIGWDAADWKIIHPLLDAGAMPTLEAFINGGAIGNLATLQPILSPMLWNSIATGKRPHRHGIHGFVEVKPDGTGIRPVMSTSRKVKAIWNMVTQAEMKSQVFSWFASHPAEPIDGVCVSNLFPQMPPDLGGAWPLSSDAIHPQRLHETLKALRVHPTEIEGCHLQPFMPRAAEIDQSDEFGAKALKRMALALAECATVHAAATWTIEHEPWDFCAIYYNAIDRVCHDFMTFHPPAQNLEDNKWADLFRDVVNGIYRFHDMMLERLLQLAGPDTTVLIVSDHGFHSDHLRPRETPETPLGPAVWHRAHGILAIRGPGIQADERIYGASILDITPTVLTLLGLPVGEDMDGKVLSDAFVEPPSVNRIPSWEELGGNAGMHPPGLAPEHSPAADEALQQLIELGYVAALSDEEKTTIKMAKIESTFNLAVSLLDANLPNQAIPPLESLHQECNDDRFALMLAQAYVAAGRLDQARDRLEALLERRTPPNDTHADERASHSPLPKADLLLGTIKFEQGQADEALVHLKRAEATNATMPTLHSQLGYIYLHRRLWADAERAFNTALVIDGDNARACHGLAVALLRQNRPADAAEWALRAIGLQHFFPAAHFQLGLILARLNWPERAVEAFEAGLKMRPNAAAAHRYLCRLYARLGQDEKARAHRRLASLTQTTGAIVPVTNCPTSPAPGCGVRPEYSEATSPH